MGDYDGDGDSGDAADVDNDGDEHDNDENDSDEKDEHDSHEIHDMWGNDMHQLPNGSWATEKTDLLTGQTEYEQDGKIIVTEGKDFAGNDVLMEGSGREVIATEFNVGGNNSIYGENGSIITEIDGYGGVVFRVDSQPTDSRDDSSNIREQNTMTAGKEDTGENIGLDNNQNSGDYSHDSGKRMIKRNINNRLSPEELINQIRQEAIEANEKSSNSSFDSQHTRRILIIFLIVLVVIIMVMLMLFAASTTDGGSINSLITAFLCV